MYIARFSYAVLPINRQRAIDFIHREVEAAQRKQLTARLLVPLTRGHGCAALQFEVELDSLDQLDRIRERGMESEQDGNWMRAFSEILLSPPEVQLLRVETVHVTSPRIETEVDQLRRQLASAKADNEILRKSAMYFAKESHGRADAPAACAN